MKGFRRFAAVEALMLVGAPLAGCANIQTLQGWSPRPAAVPELTLSDTASSADPPSATGLDTRLLYSADPESGIGARWAEIPGNAAFNAELRRLVKDAIEAQSAATGTPYSPAADAPPASQGCAPGATTRPAAELLADPSITPQTGGATVTIVCEIVAASGPVLAEAVRIITAEGGEARTDSTTVLYADTSGAFVATKDDLLTDDGVRTLLAHVVQSLKAAAGALEPRMREDPAAFPVDQLRSWFSDFSFAADGSLVVHLPEDFSTRELDALVDVPKPSPLVLTVPAAIAAPLLSSAGAQVQTALASAAPLALPSAPPRGLEDVDCALFACVALTFDDGPGPYTAEVLDALQSRRSAATFFVQGAYVARYAELLLRMRDEGHQIGNHTWNHPDLRKLPDGEVAEQISRTSAAIRSVTGSAPDIFRPPYGGYDDRVLANAGLPAILWSRDTLDWQAPGAAALLQRAVAKAVPGDIVLLHDVHQGTARVTPEIIDGLLERGFTLVTVEQLLGGTPAPGSVTRR